MDLLDTILQKYRLKITDFPSTVEITDPNSFLDNQTIVGCCKSSGWTIEELRYHLAQLLIEKGYNS